MSAIVVAKNITEIKGFNELNRKLKNLDDKVTRREVLKLQRQIAKPVVAAYRDKLPVSGKNKLFKGERYPSGTLRDGVKIEAVPARKSEGNPSIAIRPGRKGGKNPFYKFNVLLKGVITGAEIRRGARRSNRPNSVEKARDEVLRSKRSILESANLKKINAYVQKQINRLSK